MQSIFKSTFLILAAASTLAAQSGDDIIRKSMEAQGGENLKAIKTVRLTGKAYIGGKIEAPLVYRSKRPVRYRTEIDIQGHTMTEAFDGKVKWISDGATPVASPPETIKDVYDNADPLGNPLFDYKEKGNTVEYAGKADSDGQPCYKFNVKLKSGNTATVYLDQKSYLTFKVIIKTGPLEAESHPNDYRKVNNVLVPFANTVKVNGQEVLRMKYEQAELNINVDDSVFNMPAAKK